MKPLTLLVLALGFAAAAAAEPLPCQLGPAARAPSSPALYSFADVYRLTVAGAAMGEFPVPDALIRVAVSQPAAAETQFSIGALPQPERWLLILSGLAAAAWVARRRLGYST